MPLDVPWLLRKEQDMPGPQANPWAPSTDHGNKEPPQIPDVIHNHYYTTSPNPAPWYRRKNFFWTAVAVLAFIVVASAVILGVVLKLEVGKGPSRGVESNVGHAGSSSRPPTDNGTPPSLTKTLSQVPNIDSSTMSTPTPGQTTATRAGNSDIAIGVSASTLTTASSSSLAATSSPSSQSMVSSSSMSSTTSSTAAAKTQSEIFTVSENSQLASVYVGNEQTKLHRRLLVWQGNGRKLIIAEWSASGKTYYRVNDKLKSQMTDAKPGTPLAMTASGSGVVHIFFLDADNALSHVFQAATGGWKASTPSKFNGPIIATDSSALSAAWHQGQNGVEMLGVTYESSGHVRLAMTDKPDGESTWQVMDVASIPGPVPGIAETPCFSIAGDWRDSLGSRKILMAARVRDGLFAWECSIDAWPPSSQPPCLRMNDTLRDDKGRDDFFIPPPRQLGWIRLDDSGKRDSNVGYDFSLISLGEDGFIGENRIGAGVPRKAGPGLDTELSVRAISTTDEAIVFAAAGDDIYVYQLDPDGGTWRAEGPLMPARGATVRVPADQSLGISA